MIANILNTKNFAKKNVLKRNNAAIIGTTPDAVDNIVDIVKNSDSSSLVIENGYFGIHIGGEHVT